VSLFVDTSVWSLALRRDSSSHVKDMVMKQVSASKFKEQCLSLLDSVDPEGIVVTKRGKPVAKLIPFGNDSADLIGSLKGKLKTKGEIISTGIRWDAEC
jgi:prevent-host-death family protein